MMKTLILVILFFPCFLCSSFVSEEASALATEERGETLSAQERYTLVLDAFEKKEWRDLEEAARFMLRDFSETPFADEMTYFLGVSFFSRSEYELANKEFSTYLKTPSTPKYFESALNYKFQIAEKFKEGARKHLMGMKRLPKWVPGFDDALEIYDEVIAALPHHDLAAHSLFSKAGLLLKRDDFRGSIESYQTLIRRFPKHPLAAESYIGIGEVYLTQSKLEYPDPDYLDLVEINLRKFQTNFPKEEKIQIAKQMLGEMQNYYAKDLWETARFFERTKKLGAAKIYYTKIVSTYPYAPITESATKRLALVEEQLAKAAAKKQPKT